MHRGIDALQGSVGRSEGLLLLGQGICFLHLRPRCLRADDLRVLESFKASISPQSAVPPPAAGPARPDEVPAFLWLSGVLQSHRNP